MDFYPLNLVLASAIASATLFLGYLPTRWLRLDIFIRQPLWLGAGWLAVAAAVPPAIFHYDIFLALLCFIAWWRLRGDHVLGGKLWLCVAAGLGVSLGVVLILAGEPGAWPADRPSWAQVLFLISVYLGGAIVGLAGVLCVFTLPEASRAGVTALRQAGLLVGLVLVQAGLMLFAFFAGSLASATPRGRLLFGGHVLVDPIAIAGFCGVFILPVLAYLARRRIGSARPSTAGFMLRAICALEFVTAVLALLRPP